MNAVDAVRVPGRRSVDWAADLISRVGFPIVVALILLFFLRTDLQKVVAVEEENGRRLDRVIFLLERK